VPVGGGLSGNFCSAGGCSFAFLGPPPPPDEEELAIFDLLTKPEPKLTKPQEVAVKRIARALLAKLKREKLILDWRLKENAKADVRQTIRVGISGIRCRPSSIIRRSA
jgi:hypothetical protein